MFSNVTNKYNHILFLFLKFSHSVFSILSSTPTGNEMQAIVTYTYDLKVIIILYRDGHFHYWKII